MDWDAELGDATDWLDARTRLQDLRNGTPGAQALIDALAYDFPAPDGPDAPFSAMFETAAGRYPKALADLAQEDLEAWAELHDEIHAPLIRARLADLLWVRRHDNAFLYAQSAIDAYLVQSEAQLRDGAEEPSVAMNRKECLARAFDIAKETNSPSLNAISLAALSVVERELASAAPTPGVVIPLLDKLAGIKADARLPLSGVLGAARIAFRGDPRLSEGVIEVQMRAAVDDAKRRALAEDLFQVWADAAERTDGLIAVDNMQRAREIASSFGLREQLATARRRLAELGPAANADFSDVGTDITIPSEEIAGFLQHFETDPEQWLHRFAAFLPVPSDLEEEERALRDRITKSFRFWIPTHVVSPDGLTVQILTEPEQHLPFERARDRTIGLLFWAAMAQKVLARVPEELRTRDAIEGFFRTPLVSEDVLDRILTAFSHYWSGMYDEAVCIVVPRLEAILRELSRAVGISTFKDHTAAEPGMYRALGALLHDLRRFLPTPVHTYLDSLLGDPLGFNLRNRLCHGLLVTGTAAEAALALHAASVLATLRVASGLEGSVPTPAERAANEPAKPDTETT